MPAYIISAETPTVEVTGSERVCIVVNKDVVVVLPSGPTGEEAFRSALVLSRRLLEVVLARIYPTSLHMQ